MLPDESAPRELPTTGPFELRGDLTRLVIYNEPSEQGDQSDTIEWTVSEAGRSLHLSFWWPGSCGLAVRDASLYEGRSGTQHSAEGQKPEGLPEGGAGCIHGLLA